MSIPGALAGGLGRPYPGDGGMVNNMPVDGQRPRGRRGDRGDISAVAYPESPVGIGHDRSPTTYMTQVGTEKQKALAGPQGTSC